jgi:hemin uptake protein HemP
MCESNKVEEFKSGSNDSDVNLERTVSGLPSRVMESAELFGGENEIGIVHQGAMYRLRVTRGGKLILNK